MGFSQGVGKWFFNSFTWWDHPAKYEQKSKRQETNEKMLTIKTVLKFIFDMVVVFYLIYCIQDGLTNVLLFLKWICSLFVTCILVRVLGYNYLYCDKCLACILTLCLIRCLERCRAYWLASCPAVCSFVCCYASWVAVNVVWQLFHGKFFHREENSLKMLSLCSKYTKSISWDQLYIYTSLEKLVLSVVLRVSQKAHHDPWMPTSRIMVRYVRNPRNDVFNVCSVATACMHFVV